MILQCLLQKIFEIFQSTEDLLNRLEPNITSFGIDSCRCEKREDRGNDALLRFQFRLCVTCSTKLS